METSLGQPGMFDDGGGCAALTMPQGVAEKRVMPIVPSGFDEHTAEMRIAGLGDRAADGSGAARVFGRNQTHEGHGAGRRGKAARVAKLRSDRERGEIVDAAEAAQAFDPVAQRVDGEKLAQLEIDGVESGDAFIDGTYVGPMGVLQGRQRPALGLQPLGVAFGPRAFGRGKAATVAQEKVREAMSGAEEIRADVFAAAQEIAHGLFELGRNVNRGEGAGAIEDGELARVTAIGFDAVTGTARD